jgi:hypothetical protein
MPNGETIVHDIPPQSEIQILYRRLTFHYHRLILFHRLLTLQEQFIQAWPNNLFALILAFLTKLTKGLTLSSDHCKAISQLDQDSHIARVAVAVVVLQYYPTHYRHR